MSDICLIRETSLSLYTNADFENYSDFGFKIDKHILFFARKCTFEKKMLNLIILDNKKEFRFKIPTTATVAVSTAAATFTVLPMYYVFRDSF